MSLSLGGPPPLSPLRQELKLSKGARDHFKSPTWTLNDPITGRYYLLGWKEFEMLARWDMGQAVSVAASVSRETVFSVTADEVMGLNSFLRQHALTIPLGSEDVEHLIKRYRAKPKGFSKLLKSYMFFRIPLMRPDRWLERILPSLSFVFSKWFTTSMLIMTVLSLYLVLSQWRDFLSTFPYFFSFEGMLAYGLVLILSKVVHEMAHALTAKYYGLRVPSLGIAFMVFMPLLYTDASDAWRLSDRRKRMAVTGAGILSELFLASAAGVVWALLDDGPARSAAFLLASTNWIMSLVFNMNPLMRFDGYYLLSDLLRMENLQPRAFALARWKLSKLFFGFHDKRPEVLPKGWENPLVVYGVACWFYRLSIIAGIALLVYTLFFKALGVILLALQLWGSLGKLMIKGMATLVKRRKDIRLTWPMAVGGLVLIGLFLPLKASLTIQGVLEPEVKGLVHAPVPGKLIEAIQDDTARVEKGQALFLLEAPGLASEMAINSIRKERISHELSVIGFDEEKQDERLVLMAEQDQIISRLASLEEELVRLQIQAPLSGYLELPPEPARVGNWVAEGELLGTIHNRDRQVIRAYVRELDLNRIHKDGEGVLYPDIKEMAPVAARIVSIEEHAAVEIQEQFFVSTYGGDVAVRPDEEDRLLPDQAVYRVVLVPLEPLADMPHLLSGRLVLDAEGQSVLGRLVRKAKAVFIRESVF